MRSDLHSLAEVDRTGELRGLVDIHVARGPDARQELLAERLALHFSAEQVGVRAREFDDRADVGPVPVGDVAVKRLPFSEQPWKKILAEVEHLAQAESLEDARLDDVDAGVDRVAEDLAPRRLLEKFRDLPIRIRDHDAVLERIGHVDERERDGGTALAVERNDLREVDVRERVARDDEERPFEVLVELPHRAARPKRRLFDAVAQAHADRAAVAVAVLDHRGEVLEGHERILDSVALE